MWIVAGVLLGTVVLASVAGFHAGPHVHVAAAVLGVLAAGWLVLMAATGYAATLLWLLLGADVVIASGIGVMGWVSITRTSALGPRGGQLEGEEGVAVSDLTPEGIVRVHGEQWSAESMNGVVTAGSRVQVLGAKGVRLEVWGEPSTTDTGNAIGEARERADIREE
jgi:membrane-bound ClpP family serine protease